MAEVSLARGESRQENILKVLNLIKKDIYKDIKKLKKTDYILIKPNLMTAKNPQATTNIQAIETLLKFIREKYKGKIIIAEGSVIGSTIEAFKNYHLYPLAESYNCELLDLNHDEGVTIEVIDRNSKPIKVMISKTVMEAPYIISITPIKTHNSVILSLSLENFVTGILLKGNIKNKKIGYRTLFRRNFQDYKNQISQNYLSHNQSIAMIIKQKTPNLAILDGFESMERNGPVGGNIIQTNVALASTDPIALDTLAAYICGFDPGKIGYLHHLDFSSHEINVQGSKISESKIKLRPPDSFQEQLKWYNTKRK